MFMKILVVDDNPINLTIVRNHLEDLPGITDIFICKNPKEVKAIVDDNAIDILILDIIMPDISGLELLKLFRSDDRYNNMPTIMLTSLDDTASYKECFELGAFDYITKPINGMEFKSRLKVAIESKINSNKLQRLVAVTQEQNEELKEMNARLTEAEFQLVQSEKMAAVGQLAAGLAHEINNPMSYVSSNYEFLKKYFLRVSDFLHYIDQRLRPSSPYQNKDALWEAASEVIARYDAYQINLILDELQNILSDSEEGIHRVTKIVQSLRVFTRSVKDDEKSSYDLLDLFHQVFLISKNEVKYVANVEIDVPDDIILYCNGVQIAQVFVNILVNAAQAIKSQKRYNMGTIRVVAKQAGPDIMIRFEDDGPGIPKENLSKIFEPFFTTKEIGKSTGLGLSISYDIIVNKHNGSINVKSEYGHGSVFTIILPMVST
ncbi:MAG: response regulator [Lachnospiraceae bacterium]|jgi:signal transduction histidine kinase|nr:response regulator [Lachnospiraceae bacterium]